MLGLKLIHVSQRGPKWARLDIVIYIFILYLRFDGPYYVAEKDIQTEIKAASRKDLHYIVNMSWFTRTAPG